jgi:hypothetical protein
MPTHLYCLLPRESSVAPPAGVRVVDVGVAQAWVCDTAEVRLSRDARDAARATVAHDRVIGSALSQGVTPMPASLADPYDDDADLQVDVAGHAREIEKAFPAMAGTVEMTTIVAMQDSIPAADAPGRGTAYLEQIRSAPERTVAIADRVAALLKDFPDVRRRADGGRVALSHLISRSAVDSYRTTALAAAGEGFRIVVDGPRAPYSFFLFSPRRGVHGMILAN